MDLGDTLRFSSDVRDSAGALANASAAALTITLPDGTSTTPTVANPPAVTGKYLHDYVTTLVSPPGRYTGQWLFTFAGGATTSYVETFDIGPSLVTVDEALAHLRAAGVITSAPDLDQLQWLCLVATDAVERDLDRTLVRRTFVETHYGRSTFLLEHTPVLSVTSVTVGGAVLAPAYYALGSSGLLTVTAYGTVTVTYVAGYTSPPPVARMAALQMIQSLWQTSQQAGSPLVDEADLGAALAAVTGGPVQLPGYDALRMPAVA